MTMHNFKSFITRISNIYRCTFSIGRSTIYGEFSWIFNCHLRFLEANWSKGQPTGKPHNLRVETRASCGFVPFAREMASPPESFLAFWKADQWDWFLLVSQFSSASWWIMGSAPWEKNTWTLDMVDHCRLKVVPNEGVLKCARQLSRFWSPELCNWRQGSSILWIGRYPMTVILTCFLWRVPVLGL